MLTRIIDVGSEVNVTPCSCTRLVCSSLLSERGERGREGRRGGGEGRREGGREGRSGL